MDCTVPTSKSPPHQVLHHQVVLVLASTVVSMQIKKNFTQTVVFEEEVKPTYHSIGSFASFSTLICDKVDLPGNSFTTHSEY